MARTTVIMLVLAVALAMVSARMINKREHNPIQYEMLERSNSNQMHEFRIALKQKNLDVLEATLLDVSDPDSPNYGKWWTSEQILDLIAPSIDEIKPVISWLKSHGVDNIDVSGRDLIKVKAPISIIEQMFQTKMYNYRSLETGKVVSRANVLHVPDHLETIEMIAGLTELVPKSLNNRGKVTQKRNVEQSVDPLGQIYPGHLRKMYQIPSTYAVNKQSSYGVIEFQSESSYTPSDITMFNQQMSENVVVSQIVGPFSSGADGESTLDVQYGASIALNTTFWFWTEVNWMYDFAVNFFNATSYPLVVSISYGFPEDEQCQIVACNTGSLQDNFAYVNRVNVEFMKISLKGVSLVAATGDTGAPGIEDNGCSGVISNSFPASSPWVTAVGATMLTSASARLRQSSQIPFCQNPGQYGPCATVTTETSCSYPNALITSGGGFSLVSPMPGWQKDFVNNYLKTATNLPTGLFNATNRAYPDVAANGHNYACFIEGADQAIDGTSASSPVFAAVISLLNSYMLNNGKSSIGFANPLLYKMYAADKTTYTDITTGNNYCTENCCGNTGFVATKGWDAVTGLGTPMFPRMQEYLRKNVVEKKDRM